MRKISLSHAQKLTRARTLLKLRDNPTGLTEALTLTVRQPIVDEKGHLELLNFQGVFPNRFETGEALSSSRVPDPPKVTVKFRVARPGKPHLVTFYFNAITKQTIDLVPPSPGVRQTVELPAGGGNGLMMAFTPTKTGEVGCSLQTRASRGMQFFRVEIDVLD